MKTKLCVNIDHVATLREARRESDPDPIKAALLAQKSGADGIVAHLREDRRHVNDKDIKELKKKLKIQFNLEMSLAKDIVNIACRVKPDIATLVPEKREEVTTEGGLNVAKQLKKTKAVVKKLQSKGIHVSLFIDPIKSQIIASKETGAQSVELHTGNFDHAKTSLSKNKELKKLKVAAKYASSLGLRVAAGHGLKYHNTRAVSQIKEVEELNIGHFIISQSVFEGLTTVIKKMKRLMK